MEILSPIALVLVGLAISLVEMSFKSEEALIDIKVVGNQNILYAANKPTITIDNYFIKDISGVYSLPITNYVINANKKIISKKVEITTKITYFYEDGSTKEVNEVKTHEFKA